jgi:hypothetical protein
MFDIKKYLLGRTDSVTAWIGAIGLVLWLLNIKSFLFLLFVALIVLPEGHFRNTFGKWAEKAKELDKK